MRNSDKYKNGDSPAVMAASIINPKLVDHFVKGSSDMMFDRVTQKSVFTMIFVISKGDIFIPYIKKWLTNYDVRIEPPKLQDKYINGVCHWTCKLADNEVAELMPNIKKVKINRIGAENHLGPYLLATNEELSDQNIIEILDLLISQF